MSREPLVPDEDVLCAYLDDECTEAERAQVEQALATSGSARAVLAELRVARDAVRSLPLRDAPAEFWARLLTPGPAMVVTVPRDPAVPELAPPADLAAARQRRRPSRWLGATAAAAVAAVIAAVVLVPEPTTVTPPVGAFTEAHAVRASLQDDAWSSLAPLAVAAGFRR
ncbi:MAG: anti-sigma factor family protein [Actinomycetota bacterium]